jgi:hypothetical protein
MIGLRTMSGEDTGKGPFYKLHQGRSFAKNQVRFLDLVFGGRFSKMCLPDECLSFGTPNRKFFMDIQAHEYCFSCEI